jgi:pimeloyl-ACP methyl ester carboxylesterase
MGTVTARNAIAREAVALTASLLLYPFGLRTTRRRTPRQAEMQTTVFVHGYLGNRSTFLPMSAYLRAHGMRNILAFDYSARDSVERAAIDLKEFLKRRVRGGRVNLVCHSMGGLIARYFLQELGGARRVDHCITIGTPHRGTYNAYWLPNSVGRSLRPESALLARLEKTRSNAASVKFLSITGGTDNIVLPRTFSALDDQSVHFSDVGHLGLLFSPRVCQVVAARLLKPLTE